MFRSLTRALVPTALLAGAVVLVPMASPTAFAAPPVPALAADIVPGASGSFPNALGQAGGVVVLSAFTAATGTELFSYDPATGVHALLLDVNPGAGNSSPFFVGQLDGRVLFEAQDATSGRELWVTDGTAAGTRLVKDIAPGVLSGFQNQIGGTSTWNGFAYFTADDGVSGEEVWRSDGTAAGTTLVADLAPGNQDTIVIDIVPMGGSIYVVARPQSGTRQLFKSDGTPAGTSAVAPLVEVEEVEAVGSTLLLRARSGPTSFDLWRSDGTAVGTTRVAATPNQVFDVFSITAAGDRAYFFGSNGTPDEGLWRTDGTPAGTVQLYASASFARVEETIVPLGTGALFAATETATGNELYLTDGTPAGTRVIDLVTGVGSSSWDPVSGDALQGWRYFTANAPGPNRDLWRTNGVTTERITNPADPNDIGGGTVIGDRVFFDGATAALGDELWMVDQTPAVPAAPAAPTATAGQLAASVSWAAAADVPFAPTTGYTATAAPGGATCTTTGALSCTVSGLAAGTSYTFTVTARNRVGASPASAASNAVVPTAPPVVTVSPARLLETRSGPNLTTVDGQFQGQGRRAAGSVLELTVAGRGSVPADASAAVLNVTAVFPDGPGYLTVFPCGEDQPNASSVNYQTGQVVPNAVLAKIGAGGKVCIFTLAASDLLVDVNGYAPASGSPATVSPARLLETRSGPNLTTVDGQFQGQGRQCRRQRAGAHRDRPWQRAGERRGGDGERDGGVPGRAGLSDGVPVW